MRWQPIVFILAFFIALALPVACLADHPKPLIEAAPQERILLMRHAEKPDDDSNPNLTPAGMNRAQNVANFILTQYGRPDYIFAAANSKKSSRPYETAAPLASSAGESIDTSFRDKDYKQLAEVLLDDNRFAGKLIVIFWHHSNIPDFAHALQAKDGSYSDEWKSDVYNRIIQFDYVGKHHPVVTEVSEPF